MDIENLKRNNSTIGSTKPATKNFTTSLRARSPIMGDGVHALAIAVSGFSSCQAFDTDCKSLVSMIQDPRAWPNFSTGLDELQKLQSRFPYFSIVFIPKSENVSYVSLAKIARSFYRDLCYTWVIDQPFDVKKKLIHFYFVSFFFCKIMFFNNIHASLNYKLQ